MVSPGRAELLRLAPRGDLAFWAVAHVPSHFREVTVIISNAMLAPQHSYGTAVVYKFDDLQFSLQCVVLPMCGDGCV